MISCCCLVGDATRKIEREYDNKEITRLRYVEFVLCATTHCGSAPLRYNGHQWCNDVPLALSIEKHGGQVTAQHTYPCSEAGERSITTLPNRKKAIGVSTWWRASNCWGIFVNTGISAEKRRDAEGGGGVDGKKRSRHKRRERVRDYKASA